MAALVYSAVTCMLRYIEILLPNGLIAIMGIVALQATYSVLLQVLLHVDSFRCLQYVVNVGKSCLACQQLPFTHNRYVVFVILICHQSRTC